MAMSKWSKCKNINLKSWYMLSFPDDDMGTKISRFATPARVMRALSRRRDIQSILGTNDCVVRQRVFERISELKEVDYHDVYNLWASRYAS